MRVRDSASFIHSLAMAEAEAPKEPVVDSEEEDGDYVPVDDDEDAAEDELYEALEGGEDPDDPGASVPVF